MTPSGRPSPRSQEWTPRGQASGAASGASATPERTGATANASAGKDVAAAEILAAASPAGTDGRQPMEEFADLHVADVHADIAALAEPGETSLAEAMTVRLGGRAIALAGMVVVAGIVLSRVLGFVRTGVFNAEFGGDSAQLAAFWAAFRIPDTLYQLVAAGAVGSALVPVVSELLSRGEEARARRVVGTLTNLMVGVLVPLAAIVWLIAPALVSTLLAPGFHGDQQQLTADLTRLLLISPILLTIGAIATASLQTVGVFGVPSIAPNVYNIAIIVAAIALTPFMGIYALVLGVVVGAAGHVLTQVPSIVRHRLYTPALDLHDPAVTEVLRLMAPRALGLGATQLMFFVYVALVSLLPAEGALNIWQTAFITLQIPVGLIGVPLGIVLLPPLSQAVAQGAVERYRSLVDRSLRLLLYITVPMTGIALALAAPAMTLLWRRGSYTEANVNETTTVFLVFMFGLIAHVMITLLAPIFFAAKDTRTPVAAALLAVVVDVGAGLILFWAFQLEGLALAIGLGAWVEMAWLVYMMERRIGFDLAPIGRAALRYLPGAVFASVAAFAVARLFEAQFGAAPGFVLLTLELTVAGCTAVAAYAAWSRLLRLDELEMSLGMARSILRRG